MCLRKICLTSSGVIEVMGQQAEDVREQGSHLNSNSGEPQDHDNPPSQSQPSESPVPIPIEAHQPGQKQRVALLYHLPRQGDP